MRKLDNDFLDAMADCFHKGVKKDGRAFDDWKTMDWGDNMQLLYTSKLIGHMAKGIRGDDPHERRKHLAAVACNANIIWHHLKEVTNDPNKTNSGRT